MLSLIAPLACAALAAPAPDLDPPTLTAWYETDRGGLRLTAALTGATGPAFVLLGHVDDGSSPPVILDFQPLAANGSGSSSLTFPAAVLPALQQQGSTLWFTAAYLEGGQLRETDRTEFALGGPFSTCTLDFDYTIGVDSVMVAGRVIAHQWQDIGLAITGDNTRPAGPDLSILYDSSDPEGADPDLRTPNPAGYNNTVPLGNLLIVAENDVDANGDGLIDVPDDEAEGGSLLFDFAHPATISEVTMIDIDERPGTQLRFYRNGNLAVPDHTIDIDSLGDGSVQTVTFLEPDVDRFEVFFRGSGGISHICIATCPTILSFEETSTGIPRDLPLGTWITDQFQDLGAQVSAINNHPQHPDKAILFDSEHPTGGDWDLLTPNPSAPGNTEPLGMVLIIAENDIDRNGDQCVDDPDDEALGGQLRIDWNYDITFVSTRVLDVDGQEIDHLRLYDANGVELWSRLIPDLPDGSVQRLDPMISGVRSMVLELGGSGALSRIRFCEDDRTGGGSN